MKSKDQWIADFHEWIPFAESLKALDASLWKAPLGEGRWTIHDVVSHILRWDEYFLEEALLPVVKGVPLTLKHLDFDTFNQEAMEWGASYGQEELLNMAVQARLQVLKALQRIPEEHYAREYAAEDQVFIVKNYIEDFIWHDQHHIQEIVNFRQTVSPS